jgi:hypothetical protein
VSLGRPALDLRRPRDVGGLISDGFGVYFRNFGVLLALAAAVVVPVEVIVSGIGLGWLTSGYDSTPSTGAALIPALTQQLVTAPLITAMSLYVLIDTSEGRRPAIRATLQRGLDLFAPLLVVVALIMLGVIAGFFALLVGAIYIAVRWLFGPAAVVVEGKRGTAALARSSELVKRSWWRCFGVMIVAYLAVGFPANLIQQGFALAADAADSSLIALVGQIIANTLGAPLLALITGLLYFDQRFRNEYGGAPPPVYYPPPPPPPPIVGGPEAPVPRGPEAPLPPPPPPPERP